MPPEPLPWDRKDFFKERKHERSEPPGRWRDSSLYHNGASREFNRLGSADFRRPPGHPKQGDWHLYAEDSSNGYTPSRYNEKVLENDSGRSHNSRLDGKYGRNGCSEGRGYYNYRDGHSWEVKNGSPDKSMRPHDVNSEKRSADDILTYTTNSHSDYQITWDQDNSKEQPDSKATSVSAMGTVQKCNNENSVGSVDWKHRKWSRSGSMSSRGSGFSHSSSSKSLGIDSFEDKAELQPKVSVQSPSSDAAACVISAVLVDEMVSRKKQRLGWGEGLAKYEKKKVDVPDTSMSGAGATVTFSNTEPNRSICSDLVEKSPRILGFSDCASPATPSSVACSSSPGLEEKPSMKAVSVDNDVSNFCGSPGFGSQSHLEGLPFNLEKSDASSFANLGSSLADLLQSDNPCSSDSGFVRSTALNKLFMWKSDALKALEMTESEIDLLENQLKSLKSESQMRILSATEDDSFPLEQNLKPCKEQGPKLTPISRPAPLEIYPCGDADQDKTPVCNDDLEANGAVKEEEIDSPGTATSKFMELAEPFEATSLSKRVKEQVCSEDFIAVRSTNMEVTSVALCPGNGQAATSGHGDDINIANLNRESLAYMDNGVDIENGSYSIILENNKEVASRASEVFNKLLPNGCCDTGALADGTLCSLRNNLQVRDKFVMHRLSSKFKERVLALKHKAFHYQWKEDLRLLSERKYRAKYQKKCEASLRVMTSGQQKHWSCYRSRFAYPAGNPNLVPTKDVIKFVRKMLSEPQVKLFRDSLRMPSLILDKRERLASRFISNNGLIEDPCAVEKERSMVNPWTSEEKEFFMNKLALFGKDFSKIASFLDHKTTADCVEFYYKNHKSDGFEKIKKPDVSKRKSANSTYLVTSGAKWNCEVNAASLDILGAASVIAANAETSISNRKLSGRIFSGGRSYTKAVQIDDEITERSSSFDFSGCDRETVAADVLAGICGSMSSEVMSSCITCSVDPEEGSHDRKCQKVDSVLTRPSTSDVTENIDEDTCSDGSCGELDSTDWTDEEKSAFIQAVSSYGKDFVMISRTVGTRTRDQCKVFFSKARKCLGLDSLHSRPGMRTPLSDATNGGGSDTEDACVLESSVVGSEKSGPKADEDLPIMDVNQCESDTTMNINLGIDLNITEDNKRVGGLDDVNSDALETKKSNLKQFDNAVDPTSKTDESLHGVNQCNSSLETQKNTEIAGRQTEEELSTDERVSVSVPVSVCEAVDPCYPSLDASVACKSASGCSTVQGGIDLEMQEPLSSKSSVDELEEKCLAGMSNGNSVVQFSDSVVICKDSCRLTNAASSANLHQVPIELDTGVKTFSVSLPEESAFAPELSIVHRSDIKDEKLCSGVKSFSTLNLHEITQDGKSACRDEFSHLPGPPSSTHLKSPPSVCQIDIRSEREPSGDISSRLSEVQRLPKTDGVVSSLCEPQDCFLQKCNGPKTCSSISELPLLSQCTSQTGDQRKAHSRSLSDTEKPSRNGNVKLFGQILHSGSHEAEDKAHQKSTNARSAGLLGMDGSSSLVNFSHDSYSRLENVPIRSYGFWDGNRIQTGLSSLPDSSILMAKYPAAFGNFSTSSSRKEHQLPVAVMSNDRNLNGVSAFSQRELNSSNGLMDHQVYRGCDPVDMKQRSDTLLEMQRHSFEAVPGFQQQGKGMVGVNVVGGRGGVLVGGPCTSVLDPVVAMRLHFAKTEQYVGQSGSIMREDEPWTCKGDIGR